MMNGFSINHINTNTNTNTNNNNSKILILIIPCTTSIQYLTREKFEKIKSNTRILTTFN